MNEKNLDALQQLSLKLLPRLDDDLIKRLLLVLILFSNQEKAAEFKKILQQYLNE